MRWMEEAKNDYLAADHIHPPGISEPCKLAYAHIQLARALTNQRLDGCESANVGCFLVTAIDGMDAHLVGFCLLKRL